MKWFKRFLTPPLIVIASLLMWIEESLWIGLKRLTSWVALIPWIRHLEMAILRLPASLTIVVFLLPATLLFPLKILAVYWATRGYWLASLGLLIGAKILGTAVVARMYVVCQPKLMTIRWFRSLHDWVIATRNALYAAMRKMAFFQAAKRLLATIKMEIQRFRASLGRQGSLWGRWQAIRRWHRQKYR